MIKNKEKLQKKQLEFQMIKENLEIHRRICEIISPTESIDRKIISNSDRNDSILEDNFWAVSLKNCNFFYINENDYKILSYVTKILVDILDEENYILSFRVNFEFLANPYFHNDIIWKSYIYDKNKKYLKSECSIIKWKSPDCNPNRRLLVKRKSTGKNTEWQEVDSFFSIFYSTPLNSIINEEQSYTQEKEADFLLHDYIPNCLEYFLNIIPGYK
jgi:hypothetical protein